MQRSPSSQSLRRGRVSEPGRIYMVTSTVADRREVFVDWRVGRLLVKEMQLAQKQEHAVFLAWVIMPDHFHWLVELQDASLQDLMQRIKSKSAIAVNRQLRLTGKLWQDGYHDIALRNEKDLLGTARYIVANPLRAGLVDKLANYPLWDSVWLHPDHPG